MKTFLPSLLRVSAAGIPLLLCAVMTHAADSKTTYTFQIQRTADQTTVSTCKVPSSILARNLNTTALANDLTNGTVKLNAIQLSSGKYYATYTNGSYGYSFTSGGIVVQQNNTKAVVRTKYDTGGTMSISVDEGKAQTGDQMEVREAFVNTATRDTVQLNFVITIGSTSSVVSDMPSYVHRTDKMEGWIAEPYVQQNDQTPERNYCLQVNAGDRATIGVRAKNEGDELKFSVKNGAGKTVKTTTQSGDYVITAAEPADAGYYTVQVRVTNAAGNIQVKSYEFVLDVQTRPGENFDWTAETPYWSYDFRDEYPEGFPTPTKVHAFKQKDGSDAHRVDGEWWTTYWGDNLNADVDGNNKNAFTNMMAKYDKDFAYIRDEMGWPPDINARMGYKSFVYVFGSGLSNDNSPNTEAGGYQSSTYIDGRNWPCVWASYYPVSRFRDDADSKWSDGDYQREAMIHEGIHAIFADMAGVKNSPWFHEAGNTWLQSAMNSKRDNVYGTPGFLDACPFIAPFMPIECYSGWLQDGSFGGPSAEGVNMYNSSGQQICTWRNLLGGTQYGNGFAIFLGEAIGQGSIPWIWRYCRSRVLQGIAEGNAAEKVEGIGDEGMRKLILQYRAKQATFDLGGFSNGYRQVMDGNFGGTIKAEWEPYWIDVAPFKLTPYQEMTLNDEQGWYAPDTITNPGWSGGNQIPVHVTGNHCEIFFRPEDANMRAQLAYRTKDGRRFYSQPVLCGKLQMNWTEEDAPANGVVFCVVANTDYIYVNDATRKKHYDYRLKLGDGAAAFASKDIRWYFYERTLVDQEYVTGIRNVPADETGAEDIGIRSTTLKPGGTVLFNLNGIDPATVNAHLVGVSGVVIDQQRLASDGSIRLPYSLPRGMYILSLEHAGKITSRKVFVE